VIVVIGTFIALVPNLVRSPVRQRQEDLVPAGGPGLAASGVLAKAPNV